MGTIQAPGRPALPTAALGVNLPDRAAGTVRVPEPETPVLTGRVPRVARLLALALRLDQLLRDGVVADYATLARLGHVSGARISQVMNLLCLAPDLQERILFLPRVERGHDPITLRQLQPIALTLDWTEQRRRWAGLRGVRPG